MRRITTLLIFTVSIIVLVNTQPGWCDNFLIDYKGRIQVEGAPFSGTGKFKFAFVDSNERILWSNSDNTQPIEPIPPSLTVEIPVENGVYSVRLGDPDLGMKSIEESILRQYTKIKLRVWFDDGSHGMQDLGSYRLRNTTVANAIGKNEGVNDKTLSAIMRELRQIRTDVAVLRRRVDNTPQKTQHKHAAPEKVSLPFQGRHTMGSSDAPYVLVEFTDYQCSYCKRFYKQTFAEIKKNLIDTGKLLFISRNFPLKFHKQAEGAANATLCAGEQGKFWDMREKLFDNQKGLGKETLKRYATEIGLNESYFESCLNGLYHLSEIKVDIKDAISIGITGTPSFVIGKRDGKMIKGEKLVGALPYRVFESRFKELLSKKGS